MSHTPTPYDFRRTTSGAVVTAEMADNPDFGKELVAECPLDTDAIFIVRACNAHDELVAALQTIANHDAFPAMQAVARAALAKVKS
jgi:hypothetical protein